MADDAARRRCRDGRADHRHAATQGDEVRPDAGPGAGRRRSERRRRRVGDGNVFEDAYQALMSIGHTPAWRRATGWTRLSPAASRSSRSRKCCWRFTSKHEASERRKPLIFLLSLSVCGIRGLTPARRRPWRLYHGPRSHRPIRPRRREPRANTTPPCGRAGCAKSSARRPSCAGSASSSTPAASSRSRCRTSSSTARPAWARPPSPPCCPTNSAPRSR